MSNKIELSKSIDKEKSIDNKKSVSTSTVKKKKKKSQLPFIIIFLLGVMILSYPIVTRFYYRVESSQQIVDFDIEKKKLTEQEVKKRLELAHAYNRSINNEIITDPYVKNKLDEGRKEYARMLEINEQVGHIEIPKIDINIPIFAGTVESVLQKGAGHLEGTSLPVGGANTHTVITAHSGLPTARLFTDLRKMRIGDKFFIYNLSETLAYQVDQIITVDPSDFNNLLVVKNKDYATLLTCTPIMINTHRLLVRGHRVPYNANEFDKLKKQNKLIFWLKVLGFILFILLILYWLYRKWKKSRLKHL